MANSDERGGKRRDQDGERKRDPNAFARMTNKRKFSGGWGKEYQRPSKAKVSLATLEKKT